MKNLLYISLFALCFTACNNKPTADMPVPIIDTLNRTGSVDSTGMSTDSGKPSITADSSFLTTAYQVGSFEIAAAALAQTHSKDPQVKDFATMMTSDHTAMGKDVESVAAQKKVTLPTQLGDDLQKELDKLGGLNGKAFDKEYAATNVKGHKDAIGLFEKTSKNPDCSPEVQTLASAALTKLKSHKEHADMLKDHVKM